MLRTHEGQLVFSDQTKIRFVTALDLIKCLKQIKKITEIAPYVRTYFWATIYYMYHGFSHFAILVVEANFSYFWGSWEFRDFFGYIYIGGNLDPLREFSGMRGVCNSGFLVTNCIHKGYFGSIWCAFSMI